MVWLSSAITNKPPRVQLSWNPPVLVVQSSSSKKVFSAAHKQTHIRKQTALVLYNAGTECAKPASRGGKGGVCVRLCVCTVCVRCPSGDLQALCVLHNQCHTEGIEVTTAIQRAGAQSICRQIPSVWLCMRTIHTASREVSEHFEFWQNDKKTEHKREGKQTW